MRVGSFSSMVVNDDAMSDELFGPMAPILPLMNACHTESTTTREDKTGNNFASSPRRRRLVFEINIVTSRKSCCDNQLSLVQDMTQRVPIPSLARKREIQPRTILKSPVNDTTSRLCQQHNLHGFSTATIPRTHILPVRANPDLCWLSCDLYSSVFHRLLCFQSYHNIQKTNFIKNAWNLRHHIATMAYLTPTTMEIVMLSSAAASVCNAHRRPLMHCRAVQGLPDPDKANNGDLDD